MKKPAIYIQPETSGYNVILSTENMDERETHACTTKQNALYQCAILLDCEAWWLDHFDEPSTPQGTQVIEDFKKGDKVWSKKLGWGIVTDVMYPDEMKYPVRVDFDDSKDEAYTLNGYWNSSESESTRDINKRKPR